MLVALRFWDRVKEATGIWLRFWNGFKLTWFRILVSLFMMVVIIAAGYWTWGAWQYWRLEELASVPMNWPNSKILNDVIVEIRTKCRDSVLSYIVVMVPPNNAAALTRTDRIDAAKATTDRLRERLKAIHVQLVDEERFTTLAFDVAIDEFVRMFSSDDGRPVSLEARGMLACNPARYVRAKALILNWTEQHQ